MLPARAGARCSGAQRSTAVMAELRNLCRASASPGTLAAASRGGPISMPSRLKLKLRVTKEPFEPTGAFQHAPIAAPTSSMLRSVPAASPLSTPSDRTQITIIILMHACCSARSIGDRFNAIDVLRVNTSRRRAGGVAATTPFVPAQEAAGRQANSDSSRTLG
jgi:hypothetical protein